MWILSVKYDVNFLNYRSNGYIIENLYIMGKFCTINTTVVEFNHVISLIRKVNSKSFKLKLDT